MFARYAAELPAMTALFADHGRPAGVTLDNALAVEAGKRMIDHLVAGRADGRTQ